MKAKPTRTPFVDPFDDLSDEAFEREVLEALDQATTKISLRVPNEPLPWATYEAGGRKSRSSISIAHEGSN